MQIQNSMDILREEDWNDAEKNIYPKKLLFDEPWLRYLTQYPKIWLDMPNTWDSCLLYTSPSPRDGW